MAHPNPHPVPFTEEERADICSEFHRHDDRDADRSDLLIPSTDNIMNELLPPDTIANADVRRAINESCALNCTWNHALQFGFLARIIIRLFKTVHFLRIPQAILGNGHLKPAWPKLATTITSAVRGLAPYMILTVLGGYHNKFSCHKGKFVQSEMQTCDWITEAERETLAVPLLQLLCKHVDEAGHLDTLKWNHLLNNHNNGYWFNHIKTRLRDGGVFCLDEIARRIRNGAPGGRPWTVYQAKQWVAGVPYQVALVLAYLQPQFPVPSQWHCTPNQRALYKRLVITDGEGRIPLIRPKNGS